MLDGVVRADGVAAIPGAGTCVPLYILGSSLFGAQLAAALGLPYAFASHFSPGALVEAVEEYRRSFVASDRLPKPHVIAAVNVFCSESSDDAQQQFHASARERVALIVPKGVDYTDEQADQVLAMPQGQHLLQMMQYSAVGTPPEVASYLDEFLSHSGADELIVSHSTPFVEERMTSIRLTADLVDRVGV